MLARSNGQGSARLGLAVSKKHLRRAVDRNRVKRIARESFRLIHAQAQGIDFIVLARNSTVRCANSELHSSLQRHWRRLIDKLVHDTRAAVL